MPNEFFIKVIAEFAKTITIVPPIEVNKAILALVSPEGSPCADKNKMPVIIQQITTIHVPTVVITPATFATMPTIVRAAPKATAGKNKAVNKIKYNIFLFIL